MIAPLPKIKGGQPGYYLFEDVQPGNYYVQFTLPAGAIGFTTQDAVADGVDSDADAAGNTAVFSLPAGGQNLTLTRGLSSQPVRSVSATMSGLMPTMMATKTNP
ncbi:MAG: hypothetical protein HC837_20055 [Chloroflexaceae bacterium]|nr:hypothetical protein [Chloroflexaceae bacterium]